MFVGRFENINLSDNRVILKKIRNTKSLIHKDVSYHKKNKVCQ